MKEVVKKYPYSDYMLWSLVLLLKRSKEQSIKHNYRGSIVLTGRLSEKKLKKVVGDSWVNLHFSITDGFGLSLIEAYALCIPSVAFSVPGEQKQFRMREMDC